jgi:hypothetical protein
MHGIISDNDHIALYLEQAKALIDRPEKWLQNGWEDGQRKCMMQAIKEVSHFNSTLYLKLAYALTDVEEEPESVAVDFNDHRTHDDVMNYFDTAIARVRSLNTLRNSF